MGYPIFAELFDLLGRDHAISFIKIFGGTSVRVPSLSELSGFTQEIRIFKDYNDGMRQVDIAKKFGIKSSTVYRLCKKYKELIKHAK